MLIYGKSYDQSGKSNISSKGLGGNQLKAVERAPRHTSFILL